METGTDRGSRLVLRPARGASSAWAAAAGLLLAAGVWLVGDSGGAPLAWVAVAAFGAVALYFLLQAAVPTWFTVVADGDGIRGRDLVHRLALPWSRIVHADVGRFLGDPVLRLQVEGDGRIRTVDVILPLGADLDALHAFLRHQLGDAPHAVADDRGPILWSPSP